MVFHWILNDMKSPHVFRTLLSILADLNNAIVWMVSTHPPISNYSSPLTKALGTVPTASITIGIIVTSMFYCFFSSRTRSKYLFFGFLIFPLEVRRQVLYFTRSCLLVEIRWSTCISKSQRIVCVSFSRTDCDLCIYYLFVWPNCNFLHSS